LSLIDNKTIIDNVWSSIIQNSIVEILGEDQAALVNNLKNQNQISIENIHNRLEELIGDISATGIEQRIGEAGFRVFLSKLGDDTGLFASTIKFLPVRQKFIAGLKILAGLYLEQMKEDAVVLETAQAYQIRLGGDPVIIGQHFPGCTFVTGFLKEYGAWAGCGKVFQVNEVECRRQGFSHCVYNISKIPLE
jgi:predicted hydrocarbon binding protein